MKSDLIKFLEEQNPYPEDIFIPRSSEDWEKYHKVLKDAGLESAGFIGQACRIGYNACICNISRYYED